MTPDDERSYYRRFDDAPTAPVVRHVPVVRYVDAPDPNVPIRAELMVTTRCCEELQAQIDAMRREIAVEAAVQRSSLSSPRKQQVGGGNEWAFGVRIYQCLVAPPGVGYRNLPSFDSKVRAAICCFLFLL